MKRTLISLFVCLLLCGCDAGDSGITNVSSLTPPTDCPADSRGLYVSGSQVEKSTQGSVQVYPLTTEAPSGIRTMGKDLLVFSGNDTTTLTLLTGNNLTVKASLTLEHTLSPRDPSLQISRRGLSYFREDTRQTVLLDEYLQEAERIPAPGAMSGIPLLSGDGNILYYCTDNALWSWDRISGLHKKLKELSYTRQELAGLHLADSVLRCVITDGERRETLFLSTQNGRLLHTLEGEISLQDQSGRFYAVLPGGMIPSLVFGMEGQLLQELCCPDLSAGYRFLPHRHSALSLSQSTDGKVTLDHYDLSSGQKNASLTLEDGRSPLFLEDSTDGYVYLLCFDPEFGCAAIYRWDPSLSAVTDPGQYTGSYYTPQEPDLEGLAQCRAYASALGEKYGIRILVWKDAAAVQPWDYDLEPEHRVPMLREALKKLDQQLSLYPIQLLTDTASHYDSLSICLVRQLTGTPESGSLESAAGVQYVCEGNAYVALALGQQSDRTLYHELFHVMETHLLGNTAAFDRWDELNPSGFRYDNSYETNKTRNAGVYLLSGSRAFVDTYSMSYPREDRARIMEYAMLPGNRDLFQSDVMQRKLQTLCKGIREAYALEDWTKPLLWEQYLEDPL